jgi:hypothetical protein
MGWASKNNSETMHERLGPLKASVLNLANQVETMNETILKIFKHMDVTADILADLNKSGMAMHERLSIMEGNLGAKAVLPILKNTSDESS